MEGKARFVVRTALTCGLTGVGLTSVVGHFFGTQGISLESVIVYSFAGIVGAFDSWNTMEGKYNIARVKALSSHEIPPHNSPSQITPDSKSGSARPTPALAPQENQTVTGSR